MVINRYPQSDNVPSVGDSATLSSKWDAIIKLFPQSSWIYGEEETGRQWKAEVMYDFKEIRQDSCTPELTETVAAHFGSAQLQTTRGASHERRKWTWSIMPNQQVISNQNFLAKGKSMFSNEVSVDILTTLQGRPHARECLANTKWASSFLFWTFCFTFFV